MFELDFKCSPSQEQFNIRTDRRHTCLLIELDGKLFFDLLQKALSRAFARRGLAGHSTKLCKRMKDGKRPLRQFKTRSLFSISPFSSRQSRLASFAKEWKMQRRNNDKESSVPFSWVSSKLAGKISDRNWSESCFGPCSFKNIWAFRYFEIPDDLIVSN